MGAGFPRALKDYFHRPVSENSCSQSGKSCNRSLCTSFASFIFILGFSVSVDLCSGFPRNSSLVLPLLSGTGFSDVSANVKYRICDEDEEVGVGAVEELVDIQDYEWHIVGSIAINSLALFGEMWFLTAGPMAGLPMIVAELPE